MSLNMYRNSLNSCLGPIARSSSTIVPSPRTTWSTLSTPGSSKIMGHLLGGSKSHEETIEVSMMIKKAYLSATAFAPGQKVTYDIDGGGNTGQGRVVLNTKSNSRTNKRTHYLISPLYHQFHPDLY